MANRLGHKTVYAYERDLKIINAKVAIGGTGAPTLDAGASKGIKSVARDAAGKYTFTFGGPTGLDPYVRLLNVHATFDTSAIGGNLPAAPVCVVLNNQIATANAYVQVGFVDLDTPGFVEVGSGEVLYITFTFGDSTAP